jgi:hypothetical protein
VYIAAELALSLQPAIRAITGLGAAVNEYDRFAGHAQVTWMAEIIGRQVVEIAQDLGNGWIAVTLTLVVDGPAQVRVGRAASLTALQDVLEGCVRVIALPEPRRNHRLKMCAVCQLKLLVNNRVVC